MLTLGIESSCDETSVALTEGRRVLSNRVTSSVRLHSRYGGVVPEIASRYHVEYISYVLSSALKDAKKDLEDVELVAVTKGPGLIGALLIGVSAAKAISYGLGVPLIGVNHVLAHIYSIFLGRKKEIGFPFIGLAVSGGHTSLYLCKGFRRIELLGQTQDDAVGEAYDKVAKILGLGFPGGPVVEKTARSSKGGCGIKFPKAYLGDESLDFSFSGIKTAVLYYVKDKGAGDPSARAPVMAGYSLGMSPARVHDGAQTMGGGLHKAILADICRAFQDSVLDVVVDKTMLACRKTDIRKVVVGGGVSANRELRRKFHDAAQASGISVYFPEMRYCTDNAAMVGLLGEELYKRGVRSDLYMTADANLKV